MARRIEAVKGNRSAECKLAIRVGCAKMVCMSDNFLSRWSRRKLANAEPSTPNEPTAEIADVEIAAEAAEPVPAETAITEEEIAALPPIEELHAGSDIAGFLRKGVPLVLKNAALRRMWTVDPSIRDFVGEARDYSWDWNIPGGVPVSGPLSPTTDVQSMLRRIIGEEDASQAEMPEIAKHTAEKTVEQAPPAPTAHRCPAMPAPEREMAREETVEETEAEAPRPRRHGSALPT
ncbi:DUF3306 domain-containing protein [Flaviflagellibacter deserti]|uniref:DUF3306 domain-containing protein n=1 Tax=Flaviflagellibacter deserti TaxID=2267266 RepID=A0ABV9Z0Y0_9HYPH